MISSSARFQMCWSPALPGPARLVECQGSHRLGSHVPWRTISRADRCEKFKVEPKEQGASRLEMLPIFWSRVTICQVIRHALAYPSLQISSSPRPRARPKSRKTSESKEEAKMMGQTSKLDLLIDITSSVSNYKIKRNFEARSSCCPLADRAL